MSNNLDLVQVAGNQNQKEVTINDQAAEIDAALTEILSVDLSAGNVNLSNTQFRRNIKFVGTGHSVSRNLTVPAIKRGIFIVQNDGTGDLVVVRGTTNITMLPTAIMVFSTDGTANGLEKLVEQVPVTNPFDLGFFFGGLPDAGALVSCFIAVRSFTLPAGLTGSQAEAKAASTGNVSFDLQKNGGSVGSVTFNTSDVGSFTFASPQTFAAGDTLEIVAPGSQDATLADISITLAGSR